MLETLQKWDRDLLIFLNNLGIEEYDGFWLFVTRIESWVWLFVIFYALIFYSFQGRKVYVALFASLMSFVIAFSLTYLTKVWVGRIRPNNVEEFDSLLRVLQHPNSFSFFSGHASSSFALTTFLVLILRHRFKWIYIIYLWPLLFVMSRIYVGVHYPSDILVGSVVGFTTAFLLYKILKRYSLIAVTAPRRF